MKRYLAILFLTLALALPSVSYAAIALDSADTNMSSSAPASSLTFAHTTSGTDRILFVAAETLTNVTGITYNGDAMTQIATVSSPASDIGYLFYLINPDTGNNNVVISGTDVFRGYSASYTGAKQSGQPDASSTANGTASSGTSNVTVVADNSWAVLFQFNNDSEPAAGTGSTKRSNSSGGGFGFFDSNGALAAGSRSMAWTTGGAGAYGAIMASFAPVAAAATYVPNTQICVSGYCFYQ